MSTLLEGLDLLRIDAQAEGWAYDPNLWDEVIAAVKQLELQADERLSNIVEIASRKSRPAIQITLMDGSKFVTGHFMQFEGVPEFLRQELDEVQLEHWTHVFLLDMRKTK